MTSSTLLRDARGALLLSAICCAKSALADDQQGPERNYNDSSSSNVVTIVVVIVVSIIFAVLIYGIRFCIAKKRMKKIVKRREMAASRAAVPLPPGTYPTQATGPIAYQGHLHPAPPPDYQQAQLNAQNLNMSPYPQVPQQYPQQYPQPYPGHPQYPEYPQYPPQYHQEPAGPGGPPPLS